MAGRWDAGLYDDKHSFVWEHGAALLDLLAVQPGERVLDLGCGTGHLTARIAAAGAEVVGIDSSAAMVEQARRSYPDLRFEVADARDFSFAEPFDAVFSNAVLHWITEPERVVACVRRALRPSGRFVAEFGGGGNVKAIIAALDTAARRLGVGSFPCPWYYPSLGEYAALLERNGFEVTFAVLFDRPTPLEGEQGLRDWVRMFAADFVAGLAPERREDLLRLVEEEARPSLYQDGKWVADYRRLRVVARRRDATPCRSACRGVN